MPLSVAALPDVLMPTMVIWPKPACLNASNGEKGEVDPVTLMRCAPGRTHLLIWATV